MKDHEVIWLRDRSRNSRAGKRRGVFSVSAKIVSMLFPRRESCLRFGRAARCLTDDNELISLCSSFRDVIVSESDVGRVDIWFAEADKVLSDGSWCVSVDICIVNEYSLRVEYTHLVP